jgi:hypothetical protein
MHYSPWAPAGKQTAGEQPPAPPPRLQLLRANLARVGRVADGMAAGTAGMEAGLGAGGGGGLPGAESERRWQGGCRPRGRGCCTRLWGGPCSWSGRQRSSSREQAAKGGQGQSRQQEQLQACALRLRVQVADVVFGGQLAAAPADKTDSELA